MAATAHSDRHAVLSEAHAEAALREERMGSGLRRLPATREAPTAELVERAQAGEAWAKEMLFRRHVGPLTRLVSRIAARTSDADDVVQDAFADAFEDLEKLRDRASFEAWLYRIALNRLKKRFRRRKIVRWVGLDGGVDDATLTQLAARDASPEVLCELRRVDEMLSRLPAEVRIAWMLRHVEGETLERVAELTSSSLATAKRRIAAAQVKLQGEIRKGAS